MVLLKKTIRSTVPPSFYKMASDMKFQFKLQKVRANHNAALKRVRKKEKVKVAFFLLEPAAWKLEKVYYLMQKSDRYEPIVILCPIIDRGHEHMLNTFKRAEKSMQEKGHNYICTYNTESNTWLNVRKEINPDIIFFTVPWNLTRGEYQINNYLDVLTCYVNYGFETCHLNEAYFNQDTQNLVWKFFMETTIHQRLAKIYSKNKGNNALVTGYPGMDILIDKKDWPVNVWKIKDKNIKRIIWAPHHTIPGYGDVLGYSTFMEYHEYMFKIAEKYKGQIQIAFKPHPILRTKLSKPEVWGKETTDFYYQKWAQLENGQLNLTEYDDLFLTSDAMIHDSGSFVIEYLYTYKPVMFLVRDKNIADRFNVIGKDALEVIYKGIKKVDIDNFIEEVVINGKDDKYKERTLFFESLVKPPNDVTASENIFNFLNKKLS